MRSIFIVAIILMSSVLATAARQPVNVHIKWEYKDFDGPITIYEVKGNPRLWETKSVRSLDSAPIGKEIDGSVFSIVPGKTKRFALVVRNSTDQQKHFFAAPHVVHPVEHSLGFKFKCLCINHAFKVEPKESWYRIVEFRLSKKYVGQELTVTHSIVGIDKKRADSFSTEHSGHDH